MHPAMTNLLELHDINQQRRVLQQRQQARGSELSDAQAKCDALTEAATVAESAAHEADALIRQYTQDITDCDAKQETLRAQQSTAKTNKDYLDIINGIEEAKNLKKIRTEKLASLQASIDELNAQAAAAGAARDEAVTACEVIKSEQAENTDVDTSEEELERLYDEKRKTVEAEYLAAYERLVKGNHSMPLMPVDSVTRGTPYGNLISHNHIEQIRNGALIHDATTNAILYVKDPANQETADEA